MPMHVKIHGNIGAPAEVFLRPACLTTDRTYRSIVLMVNDSMSKIDDYSPIDKVTAKRIRHLVEIQQYRCAATGVELKPEDANLDHIVPICKGGQHVMGNVQVVHRVINQMKCTLAQDEFVEWCRRVVEHAGRLRNDQ